MTYQTAHPLTHQSLSASPRMAREVARIIDLGLTNTEREGRV